MAFVGVQKRKRAACMPKVKVRLQRHGCCRDESPLQLAYQHEREDIIYILQVLSFACTAVQRVNGVVGPD